MNRAPTGLGEPAEDLAGFPAAGPTPQLHRLSEYPAPWWYASVGEPDDEGGGRFDLVRPAGTCYLAESLEGAVVEKLLRAPVKVVVSERLDELFHAEMTVRAARPVADLIAPAATAFGLSAEIHSTLDYGCTRRWAAAFRRKGWRGLRHRLRLDVSQALAGRALFGSAGLRRRAPAGMATSVRPVDRDLVERILADRGVVVRPIPASVAVTPLPSPRKR